MYLKTFSLPGAAPPPITVYVMCAMCMLCVCIIPVCAYLVLTTLNFDRVMQPWLKVVKVTHVICVMIALGRGVATIKQLRQLSLQKFC